MGNLVNRYDPEENRGAVVALIVGSIIFHILALVLLPLLLSFMPEKEKFKPTKTIKLVRAPKKKQVQKPVVEKPKPTVEKPEPVVEKPKPVVEKPKPVVEKPKPKVEKPKPTVEKPKQQSKPQKTTEKPAKELEEDTSELSSMFNDKPDPMDSYKVRVRNKIKKYWKPTTRNSEKYPWILLKIRKNGTIASVSLEQSSGDKKLDNQALTAVKNAKRFPAVPSSFKGAVYTIKLNMIPNL